MHQIELGYQFAAALDARDYVGAAEFLSSNCCYSRRGEKTLVGPAAIVESYRQSDARARLDFDSVKYRSEAVADESGGVRLTFFDEVGSHGVTHTFRCAQIVYFDGNRKIEPIELVEIPGERERLKKFCSSHGIRINGN
ncbi:MAG: hypothetical protein WD971_00405 [Pirellulales bacterium]